MQSSAGSRDPDLRARLVLAAIAVAALVASLLLALAAVPQRSATGSAHGAAPQAVPPPEPRRIFTHPNVVLAPPLPRVLPASASHGPHANELWSLLRPWTLRIDAIAALGVVAVALVVYGGRRRRYGVRR